MSIDSWLTNLTGEIEMTTYTVTIRTRFGRIANMQIECASDTDACWQGYEIARRFGARLVDVK